jgi:hypothetical protein
VGVRGGNVKLGKNAGNCSKMGKKLEFGIDEI